MLPQKERLTRELFNQSFSVGKRIHLPYLQLIVDDTSNSFHGSVVVSKKVYKKATDRNKLRRQLYAIMSVFYKLNVSKATCIIIVKPNIKDISSLKIREDLQELLKKTL
jgi:ribonuclease P protein component